MSTHAFNLPFPQTNSLPHALMFSILIKPSDPCPLVHYHKASLFFLSVTCFLFSFSIGNREKWSDHGSQNREVQPQFAQVLVFFP